MPKLARRVFKRDRNSTEVIKALKDRCGGYHKEKDMPHHYANISGLRVCAYDTNKMGSGFPDWEVWVSWLCLHFEVKQARAVTPEGTRGRHTEVMTDEQYYKAQLEETEVIFRRKHSSIVPIVWDRDQVFDWLCAMRDFVLYCEGKSEGSVELLNLFFPNVTAHNAK